MTSKKYRWIAVVIALVMLAIGCSEVAKQPAKQQTQKIMIYVANEQLLALKPYEKTIQFTEDKDKYTKTLQLLQQAERATDVSLWKKIQFKTVNIAGKKLIIDMHIPADGHLGAGGEQLALDVLTKTMFQFKEIEEIDLLVDGQAVESMMGHVLLKHPLTRP